MSNGAGGGFPAYEYPQWSSVLGWFIFAACILPIPLVYLINYIKEFRSFNGRAAVSLSYLIVTIRIEICLLSRTKPTIRRRPINLASLTRSPKTTVLASIGVRRRKSIMSVPMLIFRQAEESTTKFSIDSLQLLTPMPRRRSLDFNPRSSVSPELYLTNEKIYCGRMTILKWRASRRETIV